MANESVILEIVKDHDLIDEYHSIFENDSNSVVIKSEWEKNGDFFQKFSMYDLSYNPVETLGNTTLINTM
jgi:hypothetical protein